MASFPGTSIPIGVGSCSRMIDLIDETMTPRLLTFRQICMFDVPASLCSDGETWNLPYGNWLVDGSDCYVINKNGCPLGVADVTDLSFEKGTFKLASGTELGPDGRPRDVVEATFQFDYFPSRILESLLKLAVLNINTGAFGSPTNYKICGGSGPPPYWDGVISDMAFAMAMERLLLDYNLWRYRLVFAIGPNEVYNGGGDIVAQFETLKQNAEERAARTLDNEKFKTGNYLSPPTEIYYASISGFGGSMGAHGVPFSTGRLRGWKPNRWV